MAVKIRLARIGRRNRAYFRIVVMDERKKRDGRTIDILGHYQPVENGKTSVNEDRALYWLDQGAIPTDTVRSVFKKHGIMKKFHELKVERRRQARAARTEQAPQPQPSQPQA
ncbi:MAG: 30S ribosomal protein S16 [Candidatus Sumerlaeia bacterium]